MDTVRDHEDPALRFAACCVVIESYLADGGPSALDYFDDPPDPETIAKPMSSYTKPRKPPSVPLQPTIWGCPNCKRANNLATWKHCGMCGEARPR